MLYAAVDKACQKNGLEALPLDKSLSTAYLPSRREKITESKN